MSKKKKEIERAHPLERSWAAGVIDAKNALPDQRNYIRVDSASGWLIERLHAALGGLGKTSSRTKKGVAGPYWRWETTSMDEAREVLLTLVPFMSSAPLAKASEMVGRIERNDRWQRHHPEKAANPVMQKIKDKASGSEPEKPAS